MDWSNPSAKKVTITDEPPALMSGKGIPVMGAIPMFMPTLTKIWNKKATATVPAIMVP
jgi:hypothetical protein